MEKFDRKDLWILFFIFLLSLAGVCYTFNAHGNLMVDIGREFYISERVAQGGVLYKEIFNIYGPLAYQINGMLFKIFGAHLNVLNVFGGLVAITIIQSIYWLSRQFLERFYSAFISLVCIAFVLFNINIFNYSVPYSFGMSYGLLCVLLSLNFLIRYEREEATERNLYLSALFAGAAFVMKYDYVLYSLIFPFFFFFVKRVNWKIILGACVSFLVIPFVSVMQLVAGGFDYGDLVNNIALFKRIVTAPSLLYFYKVSEVYPSLSGIRLPRYLYSFQYF